MVDIPYLTPNLLLKFLDGSYVVIARVPVVNCVYNVYNLRVNDRDELCVDGSKSLSHSDVSAGLHRIYGVSSGSEYAPLSIFEIKGIMHGEAWANRLIWERPPVKEVTMDEVCAKFGRQVKIVKEK